MSTAIFSNFLEIEFTLFIAAVIANIIMMSVVVLYASREGYSRIFFALFVFAQIMWMTFNYLGFALKVPPPTFLWITKVTIFFATLHAFAFLLFIRSFFQTKNGVSIIKFAVRFSPVVFLVSGLTLSSYVFTGVDLDTRGVFVPLSGPALPAFGILVGVCIVWSFFIMIRQYLVASEAGKAQLRYLGTGLLISFLAIFIFSFLNFVFFEDATTVRFGHIYTIPFIVFTAYAMIRYDLLHIKTILAEIGVLFLVFILMFNLLNSNTYEDILINIFTLTGAVIMGILVVKGVTKEVQARKKIEKLATELSVANEHLRDLDRQKTEFVSIASHQLRSPLTAIKGYTSMLLEGSFGKMTKKSTEALEKVYESTQNLVIIIDDFLNITRIEQGRMSYEFVTVDMKAMLKSIIDEMQSRIDESGLKLTYSDDGKAKYNVTADQGKIRQVVTNLIDNAMKYTPEGTIAVSLTRDDKTRRVFVTVKDTGIGVASGEINKLFQKFVRTPSARKVNTGGSGLGLYVAREIVKAHKGDISLESEGEGKGSTFSVELLAE